MQDSLFTWASLATLAGAAAACYLIVAYTKRWSDSWWPRRLGTDMYAVVVAAIILTLATLALATMAGRWPTWQEILLAVLNGFLVAAAAGKMSDKAIHERDRKFHQDAERDHHAA